MSQIVTVKRWGGGTAGLGRIRAEKDVWPGDWFFRAHFFQDPVQPGSLGLDAMLQALEALMTERGMAAGIAAPRFEAIATGVAMTWKYRGQIVPENQRIAVDVAITRTARDAAGVLAEARGSLYVDGKRIYLGVFSTPEEAAAAYDKAARLHYGEFASTNEMLGLLPARDSGPGTPDSTIAGRPAPRQVLRSGILGCLCQMPTAPT